MIVLVTGSREWPFPEIIHGVLELLPIAHLVHGDATGADRIAGRWATSHGIPVSAHPAEWDRDGLAAGPKRNQRMLDLHPDIDLVLAFPLDWSIGTRDMIRCARCKGVPVLEWKQQSSGGEFWEVP